MANTGVWNRTGSNWGTVQWGPATQTKRWDGSQWVVATVKRWTGSVWQTAPVQRQDGTGWK